MPATATREKLGVISADAVYPLGLFQSLTGLGVWGTRQARRRGLRVVRCGRRSYVRGCDWISYLATVES